MFDLFANGFVPALLTMDTAVWITAVAIVAGLVFTGFLVFLAIGPSISSSWASTLGVTSDERPGLDPQESD